VLAEIVRVRHGTGEPGESAPPPAPAEVRDPVCGMTVDTAGARHRAEFGGRTYYLCCGGCRERFLADPERYAAAFAS
jgi:Cu+-exporting ATPase